MGAAIGIGVVVEVIFATFTCWLAAARNRDPVLWFFAGLIGGPAALLAVGLAPAGTHGLRRSRMFE